MLGEHPDPWTPRVRSKCLGVALVIYSHIEYMKERISHRTRCNCYLCLTIEVRLLGRFLDKAGPVLSRYYISKVIPRLFAWGGQLLSPPRL